MIAGDLMLGDLFTFTDVGGLFVVVRQCTEAVFGTATVLVPANSETAALEFHLIPLDSQWEVELVFRDDRAVDVFK
jgi:hypothetical protein